MARQKSREEKMQPQQAPSMIPLSMMQQKQNVWLSTELTHTYPVAQTQAHLGAEQKIGSLGSQSQQSLPVTFLHRTPTSTSGSRADDWVSWLTISAELTRDIPPSHTHKHIWEQSRRLGLFAHILNRAYP